MFTYFRKQLVAAQANNDTIGSAYAKIQSFMADVSITGVFCARLNTVYSQSLSYAGSGTALAIVKLADFFHNDRHLEANFLSQGLPDLSSNFSKAVARALPFAVFSGTALPVAIGALASTAVELATERYQGKAFSTTDAIGKFAANACDYLATTTIAGKLSAVLG
jgi:hypothetical protein